MRISWFILLGVCLCPFLQAADETITTKRDSLPAGDPGKCLNSGNGDVYRFEVLPGGGWDNLRNVQAGLVLARNYSLCRTTEDGLFLLPDAIYTIPIKTSDIETVAELFEHWDNYTSTFSRSINGNAGLGSISGKFSEEYKTVKSEQYFGKSATTRIQARYNGYRAMVHPDSALADPFRARLRKIAAHHMLNKTDLARYESQLLVRDFGTHVIWSVDAGAALVQHDQVDNSFVKKYERTKKTILKGASGSFFSTFHFGNDYSDETTKDIIKEYKESRTKSTIQTHGGPMYKPVNFTADKWVADVDNNLVAVDITGDPIYYVITGVVLPELPEDAIFGLYDLVKGAVEEYYKHNTYPGCTDRNSPEFSFQANVDDGSCNPLSTTQTFGGVYQICEGTGYKDMCARRRQKNPLTGNYGCPEGYESILMNEVTKTSWVNRRSCHGHWVFKRCTTVPEHASATYKAYWCSATDAVVATRGFLFGGLYTSRTNNPLTASPSCPLQFYPLHVLDLFVCVSDDYELDAGHFVPFAGFYSCISGNPLAVKNFDTPQLASDGQHALMTYITESGASSWPKSCPKNYSQHLAMVDNGCEINYCIKAGALSPHGFPNVQRQPFMERPQNTFKDIADVNFTRDGTEWVFTETVMDLFSQASGNGATGMLGSTGSGSDESSSGISGDISGAGIAGISIFATLACVFVTTVVVVAIRRRRNRNRNNVYENTVVTSNVHSETISAVRGIVTEA